MLVEMVMEFDFVFLGQSILKQQSQRWTIKVSCFDFFFGKLYKTNNSEHERVNSGCITNISESLNSTM